MTDRRFVVKLTATMCSGLNGPSTVTPDSDHLIYTNAKINSNVLHY